MSEKLERWKISLIPSERTEGLQGNTHCEHHGLACAQFSLEPGDDVRESRVLTGAAEALLPHADQHVQAEIAVGRLVKVLESPHMLSVILHILHRTGEKQIPLNEINSRICKCQ